MRGIYEICFDMGLGAIIYIPSSINIRSGIQKLKGMDLGWRLHKPTLYRVFQKELHNFESLYKCIQRACTVF
jgi:hypothetical protein